MIILDNYSIRKTNRPGFKMTGYVYGHFNPKFNDGAGIVISNPIAFDRINRIIVTRSGTRYKLGKINPEYADRYADAENRLFQTLEDKLKPNT
jgi:hypothetical protein